MCHLQSTHSPNNNYTVAVVCAILPFAPSGSSVLAFVVREWCEGCTHVTTHKPSPNPCVILKVKRAVF